MDQKHNEIAIRALQAENHGLEERIAELQNLNALILEGIERSGQTFGPCRICGLPIVGIPDGLPACESCAVKEIQESEGE